MAAVQPPPPGVVLRTLKHKPDGNAGRGGGGRPGNAGCGCAGRTSPGFPCPPSTGNCVVWETFRVDGRFADILSIAMPNPSPGGVDPPKICGKKNGAHMRQLVTELFQWIRFTCFVVLKMRKCFLPCECGVDSPQKCSICNAHFCDAPLQFALCR